MKCANLHGINDLRYEEIQKPACGEDEVLVQVVNCGICGSDIPRVYTKGTYSFPLVIGHEFSGKVVMDPANELTGKKVAVFPLLPCFECESCKVGNYATCENYDYYGSRRDGGMSEYLAVKRWNILPVADNVSYREAAMCEPASVARHAVSKLNIQPGENLLVSGAGPIGILVGQWAKVFGAENVYYFDVDDRKIDFCKSLGFKQYEKDVHIHCVLEGTGFTDALSKCLEAIAPGGRMVLMGNPSKEVCLSQNTYWHILRKELTVYGTWNSSYNPKQNDWVESLKAMAEGKIDVKPLITHVFPLAQCNEAFEMMKNRTEFFNKVMLEMGGNATKPVFVMQHHHPSGTVYGSGAAGGKQAGLYNLLSKYPQVVDFSGHSHYPISDPRNVWQDAFTAIGTGTLYYTGFDINGGPTGVYPDGYQGDYSTSGSKNGADYGVFQIIEVNAENDIRVIVYDLRSFEEISRFVIENPAIAANHVTNEQKAEASVVPEFASGAELEIRDVDGVKYVYVPQAVSTEVIESYRAKVTVDGVTTTYYGLSGYVYPTQPEVVSIKIGQLDLNESYRIEVVAVNAYGKESTVPLVLASVPVAEVTFDLNYEGAPAYNEVIHVTEGSAYGTLPTPTRKYHTFDGWYTDAACSGEAVTAQTTASNSHTLYAKWTFDAAAAGFEFTYASGIDQYYATVATVEMDGELAFKYTTKNTTDGPPAAEHRRVHLKITNGEKQIMSMQVKITECSGTPALVIYDEYAAGKNMKVGQVITDAEGNIVDGNNLELNKWYTVTWITDASAYYQIRPFVETGVKGTFYMKDITIKDLEGPLANSFYVWVAPFALGDQTAYMCHARTTPWDAELENRNADLTIEAASGETINVKVMIAETTGTPQFAIKNASGAVLTSTVKAANGSQIDSTAMELNQWYTLSWTADGSASYQILSFAGTKATGTYFVKDIETTAGAIDVTFDLNYDGAGEGPEAITRAEGAAYGTLPTPTRAQTRTTTSGGYTFYYGFAGWYTNAECTGEAVKPTDVVTEARPLYAKWEKAILMPRATNSVYSDPTLQYIEGEWVYVYANNGTTKTSAEQERLNLHLPEKIAYAVSYKVMLTNETDAALFYTDSGNLGVDIYDANGILLYKRNYKNGGTTTQVTLEEGKWYTIVHANRDSSTYYLTGTDYFGLGVYGDGEGGATMYVKDIEIATENAPSTAAVDVYTNNVSLYPNRNLRVIDGEWAWVFAGNQAQTTQSGRFLRFNIKTGPVSKVTFKLMADNCTGDVVFNYAQAGSAAVTFKDPDGNTVDWDKLQTGVWYDCVFTRAAAMGAAADWSIGYFGTGTGGMDIYFKDIQLVPAA